MDPVLDTSLVPEKLQQMVTRISAARKVAKRSMQVRLCLLLYPYSHVLNSRLSNHVFPFFLLIISDHLHPCTGCSEVVAEPTGGAAGAGSGESTHFSRNLSGSCAGGLPYRRGSSNPTSQVNAVCILSVICVRVKTFAFCSSNVLLTLKFLIFLVLLFRHGWLVPSGISVVGASALHGGELGPKDKANADKFDADTCAALVSPWKG